VAPIILAFASALVWGSSDYCGGRATVRGGALSVTVVSQMLGLPVLIIGILAVPGSWHAGDFAWGAAGGGAGLIGIVALYRGLATGAMSVVAPVTAVTAAVVPLAIGLLSGERPSALALTGAACAVVAIALVSIGASEPPELAAKPRTGVGVIGLALLAGAMFGVFFALLAQTHADSGLLPLVGARVVSIGVGAIVIAASPAITFRLPRSILGWAAVAGCGDIAANVLYLLAARQGLLSVVAPIASLYPVSTVLLAITLDRERVRPGQLVGLGLAATALVLTAV
jgi:drug/metabolite transporter (DMT)-like permease